jgi:hypothetical protein
MTQLLAVNIPLLDNATSELSLTVQLLTVNVPSSKSRLPVSDGQARDRRGFARKNPKNSDRLIAINWEMVSTRI